MREKLDGFARMLIERVRDRAIAVTLGQMKKGSLPGLPRDSASPHTDECQLLENLIRRQTDQTIAEFLGLLEDETSLQLTVTVDGQPIDVAEQGDGLSAAPFGRRGWISKYSQYSPSEELFE